MLIEPEQKKLLIGFVEAERKISREERQKFFVSNPIGPPGVVLIHPGLPKDFPRVFEGDIETLESVELISISYERGVKCFFVTPKGFQFYEQLVQESGSAVERIQSSIKGYLEAKSFKERYPLAYEKWCKAEEMLWRSDTEASFTTIGHLTREAMQEFADALVRLCKTEDIPMDKAKTVARIRAVLSTKYEQIGDTEKSFLDALLAYWGTVSDLVQRQEHGSTKEGKKLLWEDARRVVFQSCIVMYEIDRTLF